MNKRTILIGILIAIMLVATVPLHAQDDDLTDEELTQMVVDAYTNLNSLESYTFNSSQTENQVISSGVGVRQVSLHRETTRNILNGRLHNDMSDNATDTIDANLLQTDSIYVNNDIANAVELTLDIHLIAINDGLYVQVNEVSGTLVSELPEDDTLLIAETFPTGWIILSGTAPIESNILPTESLAESLAILNKEGSTSPSLDTLDLNSLLQLSNNFQVTPEMILSIRRAVPDLDNEALGESEDDLIVIIELDAVQAFGNLGIENTFDASALSGDAETLLQQIIDGMIITQRIRLVTDDAGFILPDQVVTTMNIGTSLEDSEDFEPIEFNEESTNGTPLALLISSQSRTRYGSFNAVSEIVAPINEPEEETAE